MIQRKNNILLKTLRAYRVPNGYSQLKVAHMLSLENNTMISHLEKGRTVPNLISAMKLSVLFNTTPEKLFADLIPVDERDELVQIDTINNEVAAEKE